MKRTAIIFLLMLLTALPSGAQFYLTGDEPASQKWMQMPTTHFKLIYPEGIDSLAKEYALALEKNYPKVASSIGFGPNSAYRRPLPVILRTGNSISNGLVSWTPRRMELYTTPDPYCPGAIPWITDLTIHESRHAAQMQFARSKPFRLYNLITGQLFPGAMAALYGGPFFLEGDAVVAETGLTSAGRGRTADFLEYYRVSFDEGEFRDFYSWCWGSYSRYTPNHYALGYTTLAGIRTLYNSPLLTKDFYANVGQRRPLLRAFPKTVSSISGASLKQTFLNIAHEQDRTWMLDAEERKPFMPAQRLTRPERYYHNFSGLAVADGTLWAIRTGIADSPRLVSLDTDGTVSEVRAFASYTSPLRSDGHLLYWSENIDDRRWSMYSASAIRSFDGTAIRDITREGKLFNPAPSPEGLLSATEYPVEGGSGIVIIDPSDGSILRSIRAPGHLQVVETAWVDGVLFASAISDSDGFGIYNTDGWEQLLCCGNVKVHHLQSRDGALLFVSDRTGVNELYRLDAGSGDVAQLTSSRFGGTDYIFCEDTLYYSVLSTEGRDIYRTAVGDLIVRPVDFSDHYLYPVAEKISDQEFCMFDGSWGGDGCGGSFDGAGGSVGTDWSSSCGGSCGEAGCSIVGAAKRYSKLGHAIRIHSWAPVWFDYDELESMSMDVVSEDVAAGAVAFFQNDLSTVSGYAGIRVSEAMDKDAVDGKYSTQANVHISYSGLYPVFDLDLSLSNNRTIKYYTGSLATPSDPERERALYGQYPSAPLVTASLRSYIPLSFSSGGWVRGVIPQLSYSISNSVFSTTYRQSSIAVPFEGSVDFVSSTALQMGHLTPWHRVMASVRAYSVLPIPSSCKYPKLGIGIEIGACGRPGALGAFSSDSFESVYGYVPGLMPRHGAKLSILSRQCFSSETTYRFEHCVNPLPRGIDAAFLPSLSAIHPFQTRFTADYNAPLLTLDCSYLSPVAYIKGIEAGLFTDATMLYGSSPLADGSGAYSLISAGISLDFVLGNLAFFPYETRIGLSYARNFGSAMSLLPTQGPQTLSLIFDIDL